jgi:hypothetical protein
MGVTPEEVFAVLGVKWMDDVGEEELIVLRGLKTALKDGETTVEQTFRPKQPSAGTSDLNSALSQQASAAPTGESK